MIPGRATPEGTAGYAQRFSSAHRQHWRPDLGLTLSSLGMGTYLGPMDERGDAMYAEAAMAAFTSGINVIDSAINYRCQRSERNIGSALRKAVEDQRLRREELLLCTKGGFLSGDGGMPTPHWFRDTFVKTGVARPDDIVDGCHCMTPRYLKHQVEQSLKNLGVETIDVYYLHNPETQIPSAGDLVFHQRLTDAFRALEECATAGKIQWYGTATWDAYRTPEGEPSHMSLERMVSCAEAAGGKSHRFRVIQLPFNFAMTEAWTQPTQRRSDLTQPALRAATDLGLSVFTSVPLVQGRLLGSVPAAYTSRMLGLTTDAQRCLQFARSAPGVCAPLCGMKDAAHVRENAGLLAVPPLAADQFDLLLPRV